MNGKNSLPHFLIKSVRDMYMYICVKLAVVFMQFSHVAVTVIELLLLSAL